MRVSWTSILFIMHIVFLDLCRSIKDILWDFIHFLFCEFQDFSRWQYGHQNDAFSCLLFFIQINGSIENFLRLNTFHNGYSGPSIKPKHLTCTKGPWISHVYLGVPVHYNNLTVSTHILWPMSYGGHEFYYLSFPSSV